MNRTKKLFKNTIFAFFFQFVSMLSGFILPKIMLGYYGSEINGLCTSISQFVNYLTLLEAGLAQASIFALYKPLAQKDKFKIKGILNSTKKFYYRSAYVMISLAVMLSLLYPLFIKTNLLSYSEIVMLVLVISSAIIIDFFTFARYRALLTADQKNYIISISSIIQIILNTSIIWFLSYLGLNIVFVRMVALLSVIIRTIILRIYCSKKYKFLSNSDKHFEDEALNKRWDAVYLQIMGVIHKSSPIIIATFMLSLFDVSVYSIYNMVALGLSSILSIFSNGLESAFGDVLAREDEKIFSNAFSKFELLYSMLITTIYSIAIITIMPFIKIYTANADINYEFPIFGMLMMVDGFCGCLKTPQGMMVKSAGLYKETRVQTSIQGILCLGLGAIFCYFWGLTGIILGSIISNIYRDIDLCIFIPNKINGTKTKNTLSIWGINTIIFILMAVINIFINFSVNTIFEWIIFAIIVSIIILIIVFSINLLFFYKNIKNILIFLKRNIIKKQER